MATAPPECRLTEPLAEPGLTLANNFAAPARLLYQAFTSADLVRRWWGASSLTTVCEADVRPGGKFQYVTRTFNGGAERVEGVYHVVLPGERLVFAIAAHANAGPAVATVTFFESEGTTQLISTFCYESQWLRDAAIAGGMQDRWTERLERLASLVTALL